MSEPLLELVDRLIDTAQALGRATNERDHDVLTRRVSSIREALVGLMPRPARSLHEALNQQPHDT